MTTEEFNNTVLAAHNLLGEGKIKEAKYKALCAISQYDLQLRSEDTKFIYCTDMIQFLLYIRFFPNENVTWSKIYGGTAYNILGYISVEEENYKEAIDYLDRAVELNPMDASSLIEKAECILRLKNEEEFLEAMREAFIVANTPQELARYYRKMGYYYADIGEYKLAYSLNRISLLFEQSPVAVNEIMYCKEKLGEKDFEMKMVDVIKTIEENHLPVGPNPNIVNALVSLYKDPEFRLKLPGAYEEVKRRLIIFTGDERFKNNE